MKFNPLPTGKLQGDPGDLPDRGTGSGVTDTYGADLGGDATNRMGGMTSKTGSDAGNELKDRA